ncbi:hypothetical protein H5410_027492 [Solanum commersonii]|uniref:Uncharacterized protein n=1 Tax=Solanum commersonii TaxID=4109 RepID=A0A9J5Z203_SOLCO|nr:hypothetical protein H5410_027492 [Solanum commersonii]
MWMMSLIVGIPQIIQDFYLNVQLNLESGYFVNSPIKCLSDTCCVLEALTINWMKTNHMKRNLWLLLTNK